MITKIAEYSVKKEAMAYVAAALKALVQSVREHEPGTLYMAFVRSDSSDSVRFIHLMEFSDEKAELLHRNADYSKDFARLLHQRCQQELCITELVPLE